MSDRLQETSNIWITGASSGIGESVTRALARGGHRLVITGRRQGALEELASAAPDRIIPAAADTTSKEDLQAIAGTLENHGDLNMVIPVSYTHLTLPTKRIV